MPKRNPQLRLRLDAVAHDADTAWRDGARVAYLGGWLTLELDTDRPGPERVGDALHLPLPPAATPRQIRDMTEAWLRDEALRVLRDSALATRHPDAATLRIVLSFSRHGDWAQRDGGVLRCYWRLIEQPLPVIEQALCRAMAEGAPAAVEDLFALV